MSPISETNIKEKAAVNPDLASAGKNEDGPFVKTTSRNTKADAERARAIARGKGIRPRDVSLAINVYILVRTEVKKKNSNVYK